MNAKLGEKRILAVFLIAVFCLYLAFGFFRPLEDDESLYALAGKAILSGTLNPFAVIYYGHYSNPFHYIMGSPLVPTINGAAYLLGGILLVRAIAAAFVVASLYIVYTLVRRVNGSATIPLILTAFAGSAIVIASDGFLDATALFFLMSGLYMVHEKKAFYSGILIGLAVISKFMLLVPAAVILGYMLLKGDWKKFLPGLLIVLVPFAVLYSQMMPVLINFLIVDKVGQASSGNAGIFLTTLAAGLPIASALAILHARQISKAKMTLFLLPTVAILLYQLVMLDYNSLIRHLPYAEFSAAVPLGLVLKERAARYGRVLYIPLAAFVLISVALAAAEVHNYPSYGLIKDQLASVDGRVLALNLNSYMLTKGMPLNSTADKVYSYYYFSYDNVPGSSISEYEAGLRDGYFDYALIASFSSSKYAKYDQIESLVRKYYCPVFQSHIPNGIDIYGRCG